MYIEKKKQDTEIREMKVRIPSDFYMKLHSLKLLTGTQISEAVTDALQLYFEQEKFSQKSQEAEQTS